MKTAKPIIAIIPLTLITAAIFLIGARLAKSPASEPVVAYPEVENTLACDYYKSIRTEYSDRLVEEGVTPLQLAAMDGDLEKVKYLVSIGASPDSMSFSAHMTPLLLASACGRAEIVQFLVSSGAGVNIPGGLWSFFGSDKWRLPLQVASNARIAGILLRNGANPDFTSEGERPLSHFAGAFAGKATATVPFDRNSIELLLQYGADINASSVKSPSILSLAVDRYQATLSRDDLDNVRWLMKKGAVPELDIAIRLKDAELVKKLLAAGADPGRKTDKRSYGYSSPLYTALQSGDRAIVEILLAAGADPGKRIADRNSPLYTALQNGDRAAAESLIAAGTNTAPARLRKYDWMMMNNLLDTDENNLILTDSVTGGEARRANAPEPPRLKEIEPDFEDAIIYNDANLARRKLLETVKKDTKHPCGKAEEAWLYAAALNGRAEITKLLLNRGCDSYYMMEYALLHAITSGDTQTAEALITAGATPDAYIILSNYDYRTGIYDADYGKTALHFAAQLGDVPMLKLLVSSGADIEAQGSASSTPLLYAAANNRISASRALIASGANINARDATGKTALHYAASSDAGLPILKLLLSRGTGIETRDTAGSTPLLYAAANRVMNTVRFLIANGANVNAADSLNKTALHYAAEYADPALARVLLDTGANPNAREKHLATPIMLSACSEDTALTGTAKLQVEKLLLHAGAKIHVAYKKGRTPLHCAAKLGRAEAAKLYVSAGENVNVTDAFGKTPLHLAIIFGSAPAVKTLVKLGANPQLRDGRGRSPIEYADAPLQADAARDLLMRRKNIDLATAILLSDTAIVQKALKEGVNKSTGKIAAPWDGVSPLYLAVTRGGSIRNVELLLSHGAKFDRAEAGMDADLLLYLLSSGPDNCRLFPELLNLLPGVRKKIEGNNSEPETSMADFAMACAAFSNDTELARKTISETSDGNVKAIALSQAISLNNLEMATIVIDAGIDKKAYKEFFDNDTPLKLAEENGSKEIAALLRRHGYVK